MIFRAPEFDNSHNTLPPSFAPIPWATVALVGDRCTATAVGPQLLCTSAPLNVQVGEIAEIQGLTAIVKSVLRSDTANVDYLVVDMNIPVYAPTYRGTPYSIDLDLLIIGFGVGRGDPIYDASLLIGWYQGAPETAAKRWGINKLSGVRFPAPSDANPTFWGNFENPFSESLYCCAGDEGAGGFILVNGVWTFLGPVDGPELPNATFNTLQKGAEGQWMFRDFPLIDALNNPTSASISDPRTTRIDIPANGSRYTDPQVTVSGTFAGFPTEVRINNIVTEWQGNVHQRGGTFSQVITLTPGANAITVDIVYQQWMPLHYLSSITLHLEDSTAPPEPPVYPPVTPISINLSGTVHIAGKAYPIKYTAAIDKLPA